MTSTSPPTTMDNNNKSSSGPPRPATPPTPSPATAKMAMYTTKNEIKFPFRLHQVLDEAVEKGFDHIICWLESGDGFRILDPSAFAKDIMPRYFSMSHYKSFQRQLSLYSFKRETEGLKRDAYCHPFFKKDQIELCVYVPREKKRKPKNKARRNRNGMRRTPPPNALNAPLTTTNAPPMRRPSHRRALSSEEVAKMMNSPSVSPISEDFMNVTPGRSHPLYRSAYGPTPGVVQQPYTIAPVTSGGVQPQPQQQQQQQPPSSSFFAEADPSPYQLQQQQQAPPQPVAQPQVVPQQMAPQQMQPTQQPALPPGRPLQFPVKGKRTQSKEWMQDHDQSLWNYVNGLVVDSTKTFNDKNALKREASNFSTDEILTEIASTFNGNEKQQQRSASVSSGSSGGSQNSQSSLLTPLPAYPSTSEEVSYNSL